VEFCRRQNSKRLDAAGGKSSATPQSRAWCTEEFAAKDAKTFKLSQLANPGFRQPGNPDNLFKRYAKGF
jgi:hypothetical protein